MGKFIAFGLLVSGLPHVFASCHGVSVHAGSEIQSVVTAHPAGTTYCIDAGIYRVTETIAPKDGDSLIGSVDAVINGSRLVTQWTRTGNLWIATGQTQHSEPLWKTTWPPLANPAAQVNEDLFLDDKQLRPVMTAALVVPGTFYFDYGAATIYIADNPTGHRIESSVMEAAIRSRAQKVTVQGLTVEKFTHIGISLGSNSVVRDNELRYIHGAGIQFGNGSRVLHNHTHHNGMYGMSGAGEGPLVEGNEIAFNNTAGYHTEHGGCWAAGGAKFVRSNHLVVRGNYVHDNLCTGLWTDIDNINPLMKTTASRIITRRDCLLRSAIRV